MSVIKSFILITLFTILQNIDAQDQIEVQVIDHPHKNEYILQQHGTDKHKYGYELKENKHFHHTTTEEDGVRLGCYGYVLNGKKYSTQYVADIKGYRPVYTYNVINVYPKSGGTREATFIGNFNEDQKKSENIRYFFPEGCRGDENMIELPPNENPIKPPVIPSIPIPTTPKQTTPKPSPPKTPDGSNPNINIIIPPSKPKILPTPPPTPKPTPPPETYLPPVNTYLPPTTTPPPVPTGNYITRAIPSTTKKSIITTTAATKTQTTTTTTRATKKVPPPTPKKPIVVAPEPPKNSCDAKSCCNDDSLPKLVIPINLDAGKSGSCGRFAKLVVPADSVGMESLKTLLSNPSELAKTIIKSLS